MRTLLLSLLFAGVGTNTSSQTSCFTIKSGDPSAVDGLYSIDPDGSGGEPAVMVWCDMTTEEGGWTLVVSTTNPVNDQSVDHHPNLESVNPSSAMLGVWDGMRPLLTADSDIRFTCCNLSAETCDNSYTVDMIFYENQFYNDVTNGPADAENCFEEGNGGGASTPPRRKDLISGQERAEGDQWDWGYLEGEDNCGDAGDFTVDFDDRGMDSNQADGTDWGEDDNSPKCGQNNIGSGEWFLWVREGDPSLPVEWAGFSVYKNGNQSLLSWATAVEINNEGFEIQHSIDGRSFEKIGWVEGEGFTTGLTNYMFTHNLPVMGTNYYRIKQMDYNGKSGISDIVSLRFESFQDGLSIFPNPVEDYLNLKFDEDLGMQTIIIMDLQGKVVDTISIDSKIKQLSINVKDLKAGMFIVKVNNVIQKLIKN